MHGLREFTRAPPVGSCAQRKAGHRTRAPRTRDLTDTCAALQTSASQLGWLACPQLKDGLLGADEVKDIYVMHAEVLTSVEEGNFLRTYLVFPQSYEEALPPVELGKAACLHACEVIGVGVHEVLCLEGHEHRLWEEFA